jgi:hypothetical protein
MAARKKSATKAKRRDDGGDRTAAILAAAFEEFRVRGFAAPRCGSSQGPSSEARPGASFAGALNGFEMPGFDNQNHKGLMRPPRLTTRICIDG